MSRRERWSAWVALGLGGIVLAGPTAVSEAQTMAGRQTAPATTPGLTLDLRLRPEDVTEPTPATVVAWQDEASAEDARPLLGDPLSLGVSVEPRRGAPVDGDDPVSISGLEDDVRDLVEHSVVGIVATYRF